MGGRLLIFFYTYLANIGIQTKCRVLVFLEGVVVRGGLIGKVRSLFC